MGRRYETVSLLTDYDAYLFNQGNHYDIWRKLGAHPATFDGVRGTYFAVLAPAMMSGPCARRGTAVRQLLAEKQNCHLLGSSMG